jgi:glycerate dehydrogenase
VTNIVVLDGYTLNPGDNPWDGVAALGELTVYDRTPPHLIVERAAAADIVLTNKTILDAASIARLGRLRFISVLATGYNIVDVAAAGERGIVVSNVPEYGTDSVAQHTVALLLELCQQVGAHDVDVHAGAWTSSPDFCFWRRAPLELAGLTIGVIGFGRIGRRVGEITHALGMNVLGCGGRRGGEPAYAPFVWAEVDEIFDASDVVTLHCPLTADNRHLVNRDRLRRMKPRALLINTARGPLVDEAALAAALNAGELAGAAVDVVSEEPIAAANPLLRARNCIITPHMAWGSLAARKRLMAATVENIGAFLRGSPVNVVSAPG